MTPTKLKLNKNIKLPENRLWLKKFEESPQSKYISDLSKFLRYSDFEEISLSLYSLNEIEIFFNKLNEENYGDSQKNRFRLAIMGFWEFLCENFSDKFTSVDIIDYLDKMGGEIEYNSKIIPPLSLMEIIKLRQELSSNSEDLYVFEILFQTGCSEEEFEEYLLNKNDKEQIKTKIRKFLGDLNILRILDELDVEQFTWYRTKTTNLFKRIKRILRENNLGMTNQEIKFALFKHTHDAFFIPCPNCGRRLENLADNWVLVREESDDRFYLVCKYCKGRYGENH